MKHEFKVTRISKSYRISDDLELHSVPHFDKRIKKRHIKIKDVKETYLKSDSIYPSVNHDNAHVYQKQIGNNLIKVVVKDDKKPYILITAYVTSLS